MKHLKLFLVVLVALGLATSAFAATDIYKDTYTTEDSTGTWTFTNYNSSGLKQSVEFIDSASETTGTVTAAKTGYHFIYRGSGAAITGVGATLQLPTAASGLNYTFTTGTNRTVSIRSASSSDVILWGSAVNAVRFTSPATTGSTVRIVGNTNRWYITEMATPDADGTGTGTVHDDWVAAAS